MRKLFLICSLCCSFAFAASLPTLTVSNISVSNNAKMPSFVNLESSAEVDNNAKNMVLAQMSNFSAQVRGKIIQTQIFRVVNGGVISKLPLISESNSANTSAHVDYMLDAKLTAINAAEEVNPIGGADKYSRIYSIDLAVDYQLLRTKDHAIVAAFTASGHAGDVKIVSSAEQQISHNLPLLVKQAGEDLADNVISQLNLCIGNGKLYLISPESGTKITDFKTYTD